MISLYGLILVKLVAGKRTEKRKSTILSLSLSVLHNKGEKKEREREREFFQGLDLESFLPLNKLT